MKHVTRWGQVIDVDGPPPWTPGMVAMAAMLLIIALCVIGTAAAVLFLILRG